MSLPAKIFVFLNLILSIAFAVASLSLYAKKVNYVKDLELSIAKRNKLFTDLETADSKAKELESKLEKITTEKDSALSSLKTQYQIAEDARVKLDRRNGELSSSYGKLDSEMGKLRTDLKDITNKKEALEERLAKVSEELQQAIDDRNFAQKTALEATADVKELESELASVNKRAASLLEQNLEFKTTIEEVQKRNPDILKPASGPVDPIRGRILRVEEEVDLVILSVGENDNVKTGMEFIISRGSDYVGKVKVRTLHKNICAAVIDKELTVKPISIGDIAETL